MPNSARFLILKRRVAELRRNLLPATFSPTGAYSKSALDKTRGYRLLVHAEFESYVEDIARDAIMRKIGDWKRRRAPSTLVLSFLAAYHSGFAADAGDPASIVGSARKIVKDSVEEAIDLAMAQFVRRLSENHGIRAENLKRLLLPVGVRFDELDPTWLTNIDEFGKKRGEVAHNAVGAQRAIDPLTEYNDVQALLMGLRDLDERIRKLAR